MTKEKLFSVTLSDCDVQTFSVSRGGGQRRDKKATGVRIVHPPSGARGECQEERSQYQNKKIAFTRMAETPQFRFWVAQMTGKMKTPEQIEQEIDKSLVVRDNVRVETKDQGRWVVNDELE